MPETKVRRITDPATIRIIREMVQQNTARTPERYAELTRDYQRRTANVAATVDKEEAFRLAKARGLIP